MLLLEFTPLKFMGRQHRKVMMVLQQNTPIKRVFLLNEIN